MILNKFEHCKKGIALFFAVIMEVQMFAMPGVVHRPPGAIKLNSKHYQSMDKPSLIINEAGGAEPSLGHTATPRMIKIAGATTTSQLPAMQLSQGSGLQPNPSMPLPADVNASVNGPGPGQPEMSSFASVGADKMVNLFSGDFNYSIPLLDMGGYPVTMGYTQESNPEQEASWVGLGWNINPGTISRNMRGLPDDFKGDLIVKTQNMKEEKEWGVTPNVGVELFGQTVGINVGLGVLKNNKKGWGSMVDLGVNISSGKAFADGAVNVGVGANLGYNSQSGTSYGVNGSVSYSKGLNSQGLKGSLGLHAGLNYHSRAGLVSKSLGAGFSFSQKADYVLASNNKSYSTSNSLSVATVGLSQSYSIPSAVPTISMPTYSKNFSYNGRFGGSFWGVYGNVGISGYFKSRSILNPVSARQAYGMLYLSDANDLTVLKDFNRSNDGVFTDQSPHIAMPYYTQDIFSISGEGTGGMFKIYRGELGYVNDPYTYSTSESNGVGAEAGIISGGFNVDIVKSPSSVGAWVQQNKLATTLRYTRSDSSYEAAYMRNPGERTIGDETFYKAMGGDNLIRVKIDGSATDPYISGNIQEFGDNQQMIRERSLVVSNDPAIPAKQLVVKKDRSKRTQLISYLNAEEAGGVGLDKSINSYAAGDFTAFLGCNDASITRMPRVEAGLRKSHHISQITVTQNDGKRYIFGIPAYNKVQEEYTFTVNASRAVPGSESLVRYDADNINGINLQNANPKDWYYEKQEIPSYAHSYLLTGLVSPDYVDMTNDGITPDDLGDAVKFNYTRMPGMNNSGLVNWRTPNSDVLIANHNKGLQTDKNDDKGNVVFGKKEVWYMHSIESKNLVAVFHESNRLDMFEPIDVNGGFVLSTNYKKLDSISLYSKEDIRTAGSIAAAAPIKCVHFEYSYDLCKGFHPGNASQGKLTLKKIYFTFQHSAEKRNITHFSYKNTTYQEDAQDRWGNFKPKSNNPNNQTNAEFPYAVQDVVAANNNAGMWSLDSITLPSKGSIKIEYEADDYSYVQNRRAAKMINLLGFGNSPAATPSQYLNYGLNGFNNYVFINLETPITGANKRDVFYNTYLNNGVATSMTNPQQIYLRLKLAIPGGEEMIPVYTKYDDYGVSADGTKGWIRLTPITQAMPNAIYSPVVNFLKTNMPAKVYQYYDTYGESGGVTVILSMLSFFANIAGNINEERDMERNCLLKLIGVKANLGQSFIRLCAPGAQKMGGGSRVKRVKVYDNWNQMRGTYGAVYGQEYNYTSTELVNGIQRTISSGVASYEPAIGSDENVFKGVLVYSNSIPAGPAQIGTVEVPLGESFMPAAGVGYSKVTVTSIHKGDTLRSGMGKQVSEYYTSRDFPVKVTTTPVVPMYFKTPSNFSLGDLLGWGSKRLYTKLTFTEGFKVELNDMEGKPKAESNYRENDDIPISTVQYKYKMANSALASEVNVLENSTGAVRKAIVGKDVEVVADFRYQLSQTTARNYGLNGGVLVFPLVVVPWVIPSIKNNFTSEEFRSAAITKVLYRYGIVDEVIKVDKGNMVSTKNILFDGESGEPILNQTNNHFKDPIYTMSYPAHLAYPDMSGGYKNIDIAWKNLLIRNGKVLNNYQVNRFIQHGDELLFHDKQPHLPAAAAEFGFSACTGTTNSCKITDYPEYARRAWVVNARRNSPNLSPLYFIIDEFGVPMDGNDVVLKIIRSGRRNLVSSNIGSVSSVQNPIVGNSVVNHTGATNKILTTSAVEFKDDWNVGQATRQIDTMQYTVFGPYKDTTVVLTPDSIVNFTQHTSLQNSNVFTSTGVQQNARDFYTTLNSRQITGDCQSTELTLANSVMKFNMLNIPSTASIKRARLYLKGHQFQTLANNTDFNNIAFLRSTTIPWSRVPGAVDSLTDVTATANNTLGTNPRLMAVTTLANETPLLANAPDDDEQPNLTVDVKNMVAQMMTGIRNNTNKTPAFLMSHTKYAPPLVSPYFKGRYYANCVINEADSSCWIITDSLTAENDIPVMDSACWQCGKITLSITYNNIPDSVLQLTGGTWVTYGIYSYYMMREKVKVCADLFTGSKYINPFVHGASANWRPFRSYVYYDQLAEQSTSSVTNVRTEGTISNFGFLWQFASGKMTKISSPSVLAKWKWNELSQLYNKRGFEVQNTNPLNIYSSVLYGYNETLPIATTQNSEYRYSAFDGYEDYNYERSNCDTAPCISNRHFEFKSATGVPVRYFLSKDYAHTGLYSLKVGANQSLTNRVPVTGNSIQYDTSFFTKYRIITDCTKRDTMITSEGDGINVLVPGWQWTNSRKRCRKHKLSAGGYNSPSLENSDYPLANYTLNANKYSRLIRAYVLIPKTGNYKFYLEVDDWASENVKVSTASSPDPAALVPAPGIQEYHWKGCDQGGRLINQGLYVKGQKVFLNIPWGEFKGEDFLRVLWDTPDPCTGNGFTGLQDIPKKYLYTTYADMSVLYSPCVECQFMDSLKIVPTQRMYNFQYRAGTKMLFSAWAKIDRTVANNTDYTNYQNNLGTLVSVRFLNSSGVVLRSDAMVAKGNIIEGWQKLEAESQPAPAGTVEVEIRVQNNNTESVYLDDLRIMPWNAQQVSYVYHPSNLRLMAELDANNYATFFEYDAEGGLVRKKKETIEGIKTITETRSAQVETE